MEDVARECGFNVIDGISAVARHSIMPQYATNRPDKLDEDQLSNFVECILNRKNHKTSVLPGNRPYKKNVRRYDTKNPLKIVFNARYVIRSVL